MLGGDSPRWWCWGGGGVGHRAAPASRSPAGVRVPPGGLPQLPRPAPQPAPPPRAHPRSRAPPKPRTPGPAHPSLPTRNRKWPVGGSRAMASGRRQQAERVRPAAARALRPADSRRPARPLGRAARAESGGARLPGASETTIRKWLQVGRLPHPRSGRPRTGRRARRHSPGGASAGTSCSGRESSTPL